MRFINLFTKRHQGTHIVKNRSLISEIPDAMRSEIFFIFAFIRSQEVMKKDLFPPAHRGKRSILHRDGCILQDTTEDLT